jgi:nucleotide-binding universal stress UspA family protein
MSVYHQMGHHSNNLIDLPGMSTYAGAIFSAINCTEAEAAEQIADVRASKKNFEIIFDPQLYAPSSEKGKLKKWAYFPKDVDTADVSSAVWWTEVNKKLAGTCQKLRVDSLCSPVVIPKVFDDRYYSISTRVGNELASLGENRGFRVLQTALVGMADLTSPDRALEVASIISQTDAERIYLVLVGTTFPRRELSDENELKGAMQLINSLERNSLNVLVGFCSSEILLWKAAGASSCASGKFFNLRRFTRQRFEEVDTEGGGQLPYWFEENLLAFLRQNDLLRVHKHGLLSSASQNNPYGQEILKNLDEAQRTGVKPKSWLGASWRHFLYWFADVESRLHTGEAKPEELLTAADANWTKLDKLKVLMSERENNGGWIRNWLNVLNEYRT